MEIEHDKIRLSLFTTIMLLMSVGIIIFLRPTSQPKEKIMSQSKLVTIDELTNENTILKGEVCYLYMNDVANGTTIIGKLVAQDNSVVENTVVTDSGTLFLHYNAECKNVILHPGAIFMIELKTRDTFYKFVNSTKFILIVPELTQEVKDKNFDTGLLELPCILQVKFR